MVEHLQLDSRLIVRVLQSFGVDAGELYLVAVEQLAVDLLEDL